MKGQVILIVALSPSLSCAAKEFPRNIRDVPYIKCFVNASAKYRVELPLMLAIAEKESGFNPRALNSANSNGSFDIGIMQVNSYWMKGVYKKEHFYEPCFNIHFGAYVLSDSIARWGNNWKGVGKYNARSLAKGYVYTTDLYPRYVKYAQMLSHEKKEGRGK